LDKSAFRKNARPGIFSKQLDIVRGQFLISSVITGNPDIFSQEQKETINAVLDYYGKQSSKKTKVLPIVSFSASKIGF